MIEKFFHCFRSCESKNVAGRDYAKMALLHSCATKPTRSKILRSGSLHMHLRLRQNWMLATALASGRGQPSHVTVKPYAHWAARLKRSAALSPVAGLGACLGGGGGFTHGARLPADGMFCNKTAIFIGNWFGKRVQPMWKPLDWVQCSKSSTIVAQTCLGLIVAWIGDFNLRKKANFLLHSKSYKLGRPHTGGEEPNFISFWI